jgi:chromate transporter
MTPPGAVSKRELFLGFLKIGLLGFGGVAPWARHVIVEERRWLTDQELAALLGIGQILPGPNTMNASILIGDRFQGLVGVLLCLLGQMTAPLVIAVLLAFAYARVGANPVVAAALAGAAAGAAGLVLGTAVKMARAIRPPPVALLVVASLFIAIGILQWPLIPVIAVIAPLSIAAAVPERRP